MGTGASLIWLAEIWLYAGAAVALLFLLFGIDRIDADARGAYTFRPLLVPGVMLIWPLVVWRWFGAERHGLDALRRDVPLRETHGHVWMVLAVLIPAILVAALTVRQSLPEAGSTAVQVQPPSQ